MLTKRIIPCLDVKEGRVVKGTNFVGLRDAGDPVELASVYDREGADELVFLDIEMPEMDGIQALKKIKSTDPSAMIIMCSAMGQQAMVIESIQAGAKDFIVKPFQADRVLEAVKKAIG